MWTGVQTRDHEDIELGVRRADQRALHAYCADWMWYTPIDEQWAPLPDGEILEPPRFMLQVRASPATSMRVETMPSEFEFLLNEVEGGVWSYLKDLSIRRPLADVYGPSPLGIPVVAPEILLLHKPRRRWRRAKDEHDFAVLRERMSAEQRTWLAEQLSRLEPDDPWLELLR